MDKLQIVSGQPIKKAIKVWQFGRCSFLFLSWLGLLQPSPDQVQSILQIAQQSPEERLTRIRNGLNKVRAQLKVFMSTGLYLNILSF